MKIQKWSGIVTAASPYALPAEATTEQNNLQIRKPGQLTPRPGMSVIYAAETNAVLALHRVSPGSTLPDRLLNFFLTDDGTGGVFSHQLTSLELVSNSLQSSVIYSVGASTRLRPSFAQDRHGTIYVFLGHGIQPRTYRHSVDPTQTVEFGLPAPTVAPVVSPSGDGWFIERVDVLSSGTSYYTPPTLTVVKATGDTPTREAKIKAVVQAGQIVAVDIIDGGSNYKGVPTITVSNEQVGSGFSGRGVLGVSQATFGISASATPTTSGSYNSANTHSFNRSSTTPQIAYLSGGNTLYVDATFDPVASTYTALIPLTPQAGVSATGAFAEFKFNALSAAAKLGDATVDFQTGATSYTISGVARFRATQSNWYTSSDYYNNTATARSGYTEHSYHSDANRDKFWGLMPYPQRYRFAKQQIVRARYYTSTDFWGNSSTSLAQEYGNYHFPDYTHVGYRLLIGPETGLNLESNWEVGSAAVQTDINNRPYIDVTLKPAKRPDGTLRGSQANTVYPTIRIFLAYCPEAWLVDSASGIPLSPATSGVLDWKCRYHPMSGQDRRSAASDPTGANRTTTNPSGILPNYDLKAANATQLTSIDTNKRWWSQGHCFNNPQKRPLVDFRTVPNGDTVGITADTIQIINAGSAMERGTKFAIRFEQFNAADYKTTDRGDTLDFSWTTATNETKFPLFRTVELASMEKNGAFGATYTDFYFEANVVDTTGTAASLLLPGSVNGTPRVTVTGSGWTATGQTGAVTLRQTPPTGTLTFTDSITYTWTTTQLVAAIAGSRIASVEIISSGQNYYREPTILFRGGGGYGLKMQSAVSAGKVTAVTVIDGGDGFTTDCTVYTDVQPAKLLPILRGTMTGTYRCAYRYADYSQTKILSTTITTTANSTTATLASVAGVKPDMQITDAAAVPHLARIVSVSGDTVTLSKPATATATTQACTIRDMSRPVAYSDFSPIVDVVASANGADRAAQMVWDLPNVSAPARAQYVEFFRTSSDQSLVFYRLEMFGTVSSGQVTIQGSDTLSDEELFDLRRAGYAALPVVLPNGGLNAYRFGNARADMSVAVSWQDRLWYGVSTSGADPNTVFFSEYDEYESCPDLNEIPLQNNLRTTDYLTALVPFATTLLAMQSAHCYSLTYNTDPTIDAAVSLVAHRGCISQRCWDTHDEMLYAMDERGIYRMSASGELEPLSEAVRDFFSDPRLDFTQKQCFHLKVDQMTGILRAFVCLAGQGSQFPTMALCYHIRNKAWWTESWPNAFTASGEYRAPGKRDVSIYGSVEGSLYEMAGLRDVTFRDLVSVTVTNGGSGYTSPPTVTAAGGFGAEMRAVIREGRVIEVLVVKGGYGYGTFSGEAGTFSPAVSISFSGGGGAGATATGLCREPTVVIDANTVKRQASVPWSMRTPPLELAYESNVRGGDALADRSIMVTYRPCENDTTLNLREYYNNSTSPRINVMRRDRGTGFVHDTSGAKTTLNMKAARTSLGLATGLAQARFAGRSLDDLASSDRHLAVELSCDPVESASEATVSQPLVYALEVRGVVDGD